MLGTYTGVNIEPYALANARPIGAIVAGYIGGPLVGIMVGIIAGTHRYFFRWLHSPFLCHIYYNRRYSRRNS